MIVRDTKETFKVIKTDLKLGVPKHSLLELDEVTFTGKSVVCLSGNLTKQFANALNYTANVYSWLQGYKYQNKINFYTVFYPTEQPLENNMTKNITMDYRRFSNELLASVVQSDNKPATTTEIIKKLSNITFFGHSAGCMVMNELVNYFIEFLQTHGYNKNDIDKILSSIVFVGYSPYKFVEAPINNIYITPLYDSLGSSRSAIKQSMDEKDFVFSNEEIEKYNKLANSCESHQEFIELYKPLLKKEQVIYFKNKHSMFVLPDLLIDDGVIEDHNLAGVSEAPKYVLFKTKAGFDVTNFLHQLFRYSLAKNRKEFDIEEIYNLATNNQNQNSKGVTNET